jgi:excisionase family DNA binding protein
MTAVPVERHPAPLMYKIPEACALLRLSRTQVYEQINAARLRTVHVGRAVFVTADDLAAYVALLRTEAEAAR